MLDAVNSSETSSTVALSTAGSDRRSKSDSEQENEGDEFSDEAGDDFTFKPREIKRVNFADRRVSIDSSSTRISSRLSVLSYDEEELKDDIAPLGQR